MEWVYIFSAAIGGAVGSIIYSFIQCRRERPYSWQCPEVKCSFQVSTNSERILETVMLSHVNHHNKTKNTEL